MTITPEQIKFRAGKIGASSMAQAIGRGYGSRTRAELFHRMKGDLPPVEETMAMRVGNFMEAFVLDEYNRQTGRNAVPYPDTLVHPDEPRIICHCDGITMDHTRLVEIKNVGHRMHKAWEAGVPEYYWVQGCGQSMLAGIKKVDFAAYFGGNELNVYEVEYTDEDHAALYDGLKDFLGYLDRDEEPPHVIADLPNLDKYYATTDARIYCVKDIKEMAIQLALLKQRTKVNDGTKALMNDYEFKIKEYMGGHELLVDVNDIPLFTWKKGKDKEVVDWESLCYWVMGQESPVHPHLQLPKEVFQEAKARFTTTKPGNRTFLCKIKE